MSQETKFSESILQKRIKRFKSIKRGYYSLIILVSLYILSLFSPLLINNKALIVKYENKYYFPLFNDLFGSIINQDNIEAKDLGQFYVKGKKKFGQPHYRLLKKQYEKGNNGNWVILPLYPYGPYEEVLSELDEDYEDLNENGIWDESEPFIDDNDNGIRDEFRPATFPDKYYILGTDNQGRNVLSRLVYGFRISLTFAIVVWFLSYLIGIIIGGTLGYFGGKIDLIGLRFIEILGLFPFMFMLMILATFIKPNIFILATMYVFLTGWIGITWYIRGEFLREKSKDYVSAAVSMGQTGWKIMFKHILPNALTPIVTFAPFAIIGYISTLVALDYLGFGLQPPTPSWGEMMNQGRINLQHWHLIVAPLASMGVTLFLITFIGEAVREAFDPKVYSRLK